MTIDKQKLAADLCGVNRVSVRVKCVGCGRMKDIGPNEVPRGEHPMCDSCFMPMIAVSAKVKK